MNEQSQKDLLLFPFEIALFCSLAYVIFKMKKYSPALLFPPQGVTVVLPPDEEDLKEPDGKDRKAKLTTPQLVQIKTIKSDANQFMQAPFSSELEITMLFLVMLMAQFTIVEIIKIIAQYFGYSLIESGMLFYFGLIILIMIISMLPCSSREHFQGSYHRRLRLRADQDVHSGVYHELPYRHHGKHRLQGLSRN